MKRTVFIPAILALLLSACGSGEDVALLTKITDTAAVSVTETDEKTGERSETALEKSETAGKEPEITEKPSETDGDKAYSVKTETSVSAGTARSISLCMPFPTNWRTSPIVRPGIPHFSNA